MFVPNAILKKFYGDSNDSNPLYGPANQGNPANPSAPAAPLPSVSPQISPNTAAPSPSDTASPSSTSQMSPGAALLYGRSPDVASNAGPSSGTGASAAPQRGSIYNSVNAAPTGSSSPSAPSGAIAPTPRSPLLSQEQFAQQNPDAYKAYLPARPVSPFDANTAHPKLRHALAALFAGMAEFGRPGEGAEMVNRWNQQYENEANYDANLPKIKAGAINQAYQNYLQQGGEQAGIAHTEAETGLTGAQTGLVGAQTQNLSLNPPGKADFLKELQQRRSSGKDDPQQLFNEYAVRAPYSHATRQEVMDVINNTPIQPFNFEVKDGAIQPSSYLGHTYGAEAGQSEPPEIAAARKNALATVQQIQGGKVAVAKAEGEARANIETQMARGSNAALAQVPPHLISYATESATKAAQDYDQAKSVSDRLNAIMDAARKGNVVAYQLLPEEGALQVTTSQGVHRINMAEIQNYGGGSLWQNLQGHFGKALSGKSIPESVLNDMAKMQEIQAQGARSKYEHDLAAINRYTGANFQPMLSDSTPLGEKQAQGGASPAAGMVRFQDSQGGLHDIPKANLDKARQRDPGLKVIQ